MPAKVLLLDYTPSPEGIAAFEKVFKPHKCPHLLLYKDKDQVVPFQFLREVFGLIVDSGHDIYALAEKHKVRVFDGKTQLLETVTEADLFDTDFVLLTT